LKNDRLIRAALGKQVDRAPVWIMRQAGRYLPEFRAVRKTADFFTMCQTPELACEVTLQPLRRFPTLDAVIIFSDILVIPQAMGMEVLMVPGKGPVLPKPLLDPEDLGRLDFRPDVEGKLSYLLDAINLTRRRVQGKVPVIGFVGGPWTLMCYMTEGSGSKTWSKAKTWLWKYPEASHTLLTAITDLIVEVLVAQYWAGAQLLQVFESWAGDLSPEHFESFLAPCLRRIAAEVRRRLPSTEDAGPPLVVFPKGANASLHLVAGMEYDVVAVDWTVPIEEAMTALPGKTVQGNLDPSVLYAPPEVIKEQATQLARTVGARPWVANLGHGMQPGHDPERLRAYIESVQAASETAVAESRRYARAVTGQ
jgi:uroporphyrinogen decarboxylase